MEMVIAERSVLTLDQIKWLESRCRKQRKRLKANGDNNKCDKTIDMFEQYNLGENK